MYTHHAGVGWHILGMDVLLRDGLSAQQRKRQQQCRPLQPFPLNEAVYAQLGLHELRFSCVLFLCSMNLSSRVFLSEG